MIKRGSAYRRLGPGIHNSWKNLTCPGSVSQARALLKLKNSELVLPLAREPEKTDKATSLEGKSAKLRL